MNLIDDYSKIVGDYTDAPPVFVKASAYSIVSTTLGGFYKPVSVRNKKPNEYIVLSSPPAMGRRSEIIHFTNFTKEYAFRKYVELKKRDNIDDIIRAISLESGSPQGLIDDIIDATV